MKRTMATMKLFVPITRVDPVERVVEGYCYVNAEVGDGYNLTRAAIEDAAADYMQWGAIREMHQPSAAGTALSLDFDNKGAFLRAKIVDKAAWEKVVEGVYKGFSVGVRPTVLRGRDVIKCKLPEVSLVDRPADWDAVLSIARADDLETMPAEFEVEVLARDFSSAMASLEFSDEGWESVCVLYDVLWEISTRDDIDRESAARSSIQQFADLIAPIVAGATLKQRSEAAEVVRVAAAAVLGDAERQISLARIAALETENAAVLERASAAETEATRVQAELSRVAEALSAAEAKTAELERTPRNKPPVRFPAALDRTFEGKPDDETAQQLAELKRLKESRPTDPKEQQAAAIQINRLRQKLAEKGVEV